MPSHVKTLLREPLLHFLLVGAALFLYYDIGGKGDSEAPPAKRIVVGSGQVEQLSAHFARTWSRPPTPQELDGMVENYVREEVFYREALALGLDQNDPMVRRRMRMKLEFMLEDLSDQEASDEALSAFMRRNPDKFRDEARLTLRQVYLNPDQRPDLETDVERLLSRLHGGDAAEALGDRTLTPRLYELAPQSAIARDFGDAFAREVVSLPVGEWQGPVSSPFGTHLVRIEARVDARLPELENIRDEVLREYLAEQRERQKDLAYEKLRDGYEITVEKSGSEAAPLLTSAVAGEMR